MTELCVKNQTDFEIVGANYISHNNKNIRVGLVGLVKTAKNAEKFLGVLKKL